MTTTEILVYKTKNYSIP